MSAFRARQVRQQQAVVTLTERLVREEQILRGPAASWQELSAAVAARHQLAGAYLGVEAS